MDKCLNSKCVKLFIRIVRWFPVVFIVCVLSWAYYVYIYHICFGLVENLAQKLIYFVVFNVLFCMLVWSYWQTIFSPIAFSPSTFYLTREVKDDLCEAVDEQSYRSILDRFVRQSKLPVSNRAFEGGVRFCIKCSAIKPDRSHHCSICGRCVLKFDHHCPWVNTCINFRNYKCFILFLGYGFYLCIFGFFSILPYFIILWRNNDFGKHGFATFHVLFLFFVAGMFGVSLGCLFLYHLYLTAKNKSTLETFRAPVFNYGVDSNAYNLGIKRNFKEVFGRKKMFWFLPIFSSLVLSLLNIFGLLGDGTVYPQASISTESSTSSDREFVDYGPNMNSYSVADVSASNSAFLSNVNGNVADPAVVYSANDTNLSTPQRTNKKFISLDGQHQYLSEF